MTDAAPVVPTAFHTDNLTPDDARALRISLYAWLEQLGQTLEGNPNTILLSRKDEHFLWRQTGFMVENGVVFAKLGEKHYQPIGKDDGQGFYPTSASKLFWLQDFKLARLHDYQPAFIVEHVSPHLADQTYDGEALTDHEYAVMVDNFKALGEFKAVYDQAFQEGEITKLKEAESNLLDVLKIACIQCPRLDLRLVEFGRANPELHLEADLTGNFKPVDLVGVASEWLRLKVNDEAARRHHKATVLIPTIDPQSVNPDYNLRDKLRAYLADTQLDMGMAARFIESLPITYPYLREVIQPYLETTDILGALAACLTACEARIPQQPEGTA
jgi:hypothetical protein